jgi:aspartyl protease family protein
MMAESRACRFLWLVAILALLDSKAARSQDPAQADAAPSEVLRDLGLTRSGTTWVLAEEKTVLKDLRDARDLYRQFAEGVMGQQELAFGAQNRQATVLQLREQTEFMGQQIAQLDQQLEALNYPGAGGLVQQQRNQISQQRNQIVAANNRAVNQLNTLQEQAKDPEQDLRFQLNAEVDTSREKYMQAVFDLRKSVDDVLAKYNGLEKNPKVIKALADLSASTKNKHKLGPSKALQDAMKVLGKAEASVQTGTIELRKENGVFHLTATLGKVPTKMVFDTGAGLTTISSSLAKKIGLKPRPTDEKIQLKTADGTLVEGKKMTIPLVRVNKFAIQNVECAVMPEEKGDVDPLLGQSFFKHFKVEFSAEAAKLSLKRVEAENADSSLAEGDEPTRPAAKAAAKSRRPRAQPKAAAKTKRSTRARPATPAGGDTPAPDDGAGAPPN